MAPDLSSISLSSPRQRPRAATTAQSTTEPTTISSRRPSQVMPPPAMPLSPTTYTGSPPGEYGSAGIAGPLRHPKPLTPSDLHSMLEREQEAMVNRLSRELSLLRQQTVSVASTTSSTSTTFNESLDAHHSPYLPGAAHPTPSRRHRSSSSLSSSYIPAVQGSRTGSVAGIAPSRDNGPPGSRPARSRETSITSPRQSDAALSSLSSSLQQQHQLQGDHSYPHRNSISQQQGASMSRYEEAAHHRLELESVKRENEALRRRVRDLENTFKRLREGDTATDPHSTSALTNAIREASLSDI